MQTECSATLFEFEAVERRAVVAGFDGGNITSNAGALLLGQVDRGLGLVRRFARCFTDRRDARYVEHRIETLVGQRIFGLVLGYEDLDDHDELRKDPTFAVLAGKLHSVLRSDCEALAGKSTLNRLEHTPRRNAAKYHRIDCDGPQVDALLVELFLEAHERTPREIVLDLDNTDIPLHGGQEGRFFHGYYDEDRYLPLYVFCGRHLLLARQRRANVAGSDGAVEEMARIIAQIRATWPRVRIICAATVASPTSRSCGGARSTASIMCSVWRAIPAWRRRSANRVPRPGACAWRRASRRGCSATSAIARAAAGAANGALLARPSTRWTVPILALSSARSNMPAWPILVLCMRICIVPGARRRIALASSSNCSPIAPRLPPWRPISCACGSRRWPTCWSTRYAASVCALPSSPKLDPDHSSQAPEARCAGAHQRAAYSLRHGLGMPNKVEFELAHIYLQRAFSSA